MSEEPKQSPHYALIVDEKSDSAIGCLMQAVAQTPMALILFKILCAQNKVSDEELKDFFEDISDKSHALGWCTDPNCKVPNGKPV